MMLKYHFLYYTYSISMFGCKDSHIKKDRSCSQSGKFSRDIMTKKKKSWSNSDCIDNPMRTTERRM